VWWRVRKAAAASLLGLLLTFSSTAPVLAETDTSQNPQSGSIGLEGTISTDPPKTAATITTPGNGAVVSTMPITIAGLCPSGTLVKIFSNNVFVGSTTCKSGSYTLQATLFAGANALIAHVFEFPVGIRADFQAVFATGGYCRAQVDRDDLFGFCNRIFPDVPFVVRVFEGGQASNGVQPVCLYNVSGYRSVKQREGYFSAEVFSLHLNFGFLG
jgi:hypothetical protein